MRRFRKYPVLVWQRTQNPFRRGRVQRAVQTQWEGPLARDYELVVMYGAERIPTLSSAHIDAVADHISGADGEVNSVNSWGKRKLAYSIEGEREGHYVLLEFSADPARIANLEQSLRINEDVMRFLVVRQEQGVSPALAVDADGRR